MQIVNAASSLEQLPAAEVRRLRDALLDAARGGDTATGVTSNDRVDLLERLLGGELCRRLGIFRLPPGFKLSVVMPVYNEIRTLAKVIERVRSTGLPLEIVIVDDGSRD